MRTLALTLVSLVSIAFASTPVQAQAPRPFGPATRSPSFSPYLNLLRQGNSAGVNYYGLVRPQIQAQNSLNNLQGQLFDNRRAIEEQSAQMNAALPATGDKTVTFLNTGGYFMNMSPQGGAGIGGGGGASFGSLGGAAPQGGFGNAQSAPGSRRPSLPGRR